MGKPECATCQMCGAITDADATRCPSCGEALVPGRKSTLPGWSRPFSRNPHIRRIVLGIVMMVVPAAILPFGPPLGKLVRSLPRDITHEVEILTFGSIFFVGFSSEVTGLAIVLAAIIRGTRDHWRRGTYQAIGPVNLPAVTPDAASGSNCPQA